MRLWIWSFNSVQFGFGTLGDSISFLRLPIVIKARIWYLLTDYSNCWDVLMMVDDDCWGLAPLLKNAHPLTLAVGSPEIASTGATGATIVLSVVTSSTPPDAWTSIKIDHRRASKQIIRTRKFPANKRQQQKQQAKQKQKRMIIKAIHCPGDKEHPNQTNQNFAVDANKQIRSSGLI